MKYLLIVIAFGLVVLGCNSGKPIMTRDTAIKSIKNDTVRIANDSLEYEIIIIEPGFDTWLVTQPPRGFYGQSYLENKNRLWVIEYNDRVRNFNRYDPKLYEQEINYDQSVNYGYEVNYLLYNYFVYFQAKFNQKFPGGRG